MRSRNNESARISTTQQATRTNTPSTQVTTRSADRSRGTSVTTDGSRTGNTSRGTTGNIRNNRERPSTQINDNKATHTTTPSATVSNMTDNRGRNGGNQGNMGNDNRGRNGGNQGNMGNDNRGRNGGNQGNIGNDNRGRNGGNQGNMGNDNRGRNGGNQGNMGNDNRGRNGGNRHGYGPNDRNGHTRPYNYDKHPHRDNFSWNFSHHNWSRPLPPPARPYRPAPIRYYRPVVPAHYRPYYGAPVIDRILGITFGTLFDASLDYLYGNGYYIDGYVDNVVYLRDVRMLNLLWPDVMLSYDGGRLANAQFVYVSNYHDRSRYNRIYHDLSAVYGPPISVESGMATWFGGNTTGYVTLSMGSDYGHYYTTLSVGY